MKHEYGLGGGAEDHLVDLMDGDDAANMMHADMGPGDDGGNRLEFFNNLHHLEARHNSHNMLVKKQK